jgi:hypothetical protein
MNSKRKASRVTNSRSICSSSSKAARSKKTAAAAAAATPADSSGNGVDSDTRNSSRSSNSSSNTAPARCSEEGNPGYPPIHRQIMKYGTLAASHLNMILRCFDCSMVSPITNKTFSVGGPHRTTHV